MTNRPSPLSTIKRRLVAVVALNAVVFGLLSSCAQDMPPQPPPPTNATPSPLPTPSIVTPTPTPKRPTRAEQDKSSAEAAVVRFWRVIDHLSADPKAKLEDLTTVARGSAAAQWRQNIRDYRFEQLRQTGRVALTNTEGKPSSKNDKYEVRACVDVGEVNLLDREGKSVVAAGRPARVKYRYLVQEDARQWYVIEEKATGTC